MLNVTEKIGSDITVILESRHSRVAIAACK